MSACEQREEAALDERWTYRLETHAARLVDVFFDSCALTRQQLPRTTAWWSGQFSELIRTNTADVVAQLASRASQTGLPARREQHAAWETVVEVLKRAGADVLATGADWGVAIEFAIPRRAIRPDAVVLAADVVVPIEFKVGASTFDRAARMQVEEYALDLRDFHEATAGQPVAPVLVATEAAGHDIDLAAGSLVARAQCTSPDGLGNLLLRLAQQGSNGGEALRMSEWSRSRYQPTPGILETARDVLRDNQVREISVSYANNLTATVDKVRAIIREAETQAQRSICFVTGVPGAGKTLAGLSAVHDPGTNGSARAYMSGNGPLVDVLQFAVARDLHRRGGTTMQAATRQARTLIQPVHRFVEELGAGTQEPAEHVIVFDEAQRAWDKTRMERKQKIPASEAATTLGIMERKRAWSVIVALVGGGQEIHAGEAGIGAWLDALKERGDWRIHAAPDVAIGAPELADRIRADEDLHLDASVRSPRAVAIAAWADAVTTGDLATAQALVDDFGEFPLLLTRSLEEMRQYLRDRARPDRRTGLLASSQARRLRAFGIEMDGPFQSSVNWPRWFVDDQDDIRSSYALEVAASEFKCQGLEIDWGGLCWGCDFTWSPEVGSWRVRRLRGGTWQQDNAVAYARNRYRVLLTRARYGLVIWVPQPGPEVALVDAAALDYTADALLAAGATPLEQAA